MNSLRKRFASYRRRLLVQQLEDRRLLAGPYAPAADQIGSTAIANDDTSIVAWATGVENYTVGSNVDAQFQTPDRAVGPADGTSDVVSLGRGGKITLTFDAPIRDGIGADFAVFENSFSDTFLELGFVEVSSDGVNFFGFESDSLTPSAVEAFGSMDPTEIHNLAGKYRQGFGTPFDLEDLSGISPSLDTTSVTHVRLIDIIGDGSQTDSSGDPIFDPFPTIGSAGLDLDAIGVIHQAEFALEVVDFEDVGAGLSAQSAFSGPDPNGGAITGPFDDNVIVGTYQSETLSFNNAFSTDFGSWTGWAYSNGNNTTTAGFTNQFSSFAGGGANGSGTFGIGFPDQSNFFGPSTITRDASDTRRFQSLAITNTTYAAISMRDGDAFAKKFGGVSGNDPDFLLLTITGKDSGGASIGTVEFYLADYRFTDNALDYIVDQWVEVDLRPVEQARSLEFSIASSDVGPFGINTPAYFAADDITLIKPVLPIDIADRDVVESAGSDATTVRISRADNNTTAAIDVNIVPVDPRVAIVPTQATILAGERFIEFPVRVVNNETVDGDRQVLIEASADGFVPSSRTLTIQDDDVRSLMLTLDQADMDEGTSRVATISRNDADVSMPLTVHIESSPPSLLMVNETFTLETGRASATFSFTAVEDQIDRPNTQVSLSISATDYVGATKLLELIDNDLPIVTIEMDPSDYSESDASPSVRFEDVGARLPPETSYNGSDLAGGFSSEGVAFNNDFNPTFSSWSGWSYANTTDTTTPGFTNQYSAFPGIGADGSDTYAVASTFTVPTITRDPSVQGEFQSIAITNTTYAALSMMQGDAFAKQFGGAGGDDPDFFLLRVEGYDSNDSSVGTVEFYLADYRFSDNSLDYIVDQWTTVDVSALSTSMELRFSLTSSDVGDFGMNTPAYFAVDNVVLARQTPQPTLTIRRNTSDISTELEVTLSSNDSSEVALPESATIPAGVESVSIPLSIIDDAVVDGDQTVMLSVSADSHTTSSVSVTITDDDVASLSLSILTPVLGEANSQGRAVLHRNVSETTLPLTVDLSVDLENQLTLPSPVTIPAGQRSVQLTFTAEDNMAVDDDRTVSVHAQADGFTSGQDVVLIVNDDVALPILTLEVNQATLSESDAPPSVLLEDLGATLSDESFDNGSDLAGGFGSGGVDFNNTFDPTFGSWGGWSLSNTTDSTSAGFGNQYSAITAGGAGGSATYAVASAYPGGTVPTISISNPQLHQSFGSLMVANTTYAALSMAEGDGFAKKFGGESGDDPDFFLLTIEGRDDNDASVGTIEFYLADFRFDNSSQDYIVDQWTRVDVSSLVGASQLEFSLSSSDVGDFGMNTPAYFAVDNIVLSEPDPVSASATVTRSDADLSEPLLVSLSHDDSTELVIPLSVVIPSGSMSASFEIRAVDDAVVDGPNSVLITASSAGHTASSTSIAVQDDDVATLTLSLSQEVISESAGSLATQLLIHRNTQDVTLPLAIQLSVTASGIELPDTATIATGAVSRLIDLNTIDNVTRDGERALTIDASADSFAATGVTLNILDDEIAAITVTETDASTTVNELLEHDEFEVSLAARPLSDVFIDITFAADDIALDIERLAFTPTNWNESQIVTVSGVGDLQIESDETITVTLSVDVDHSDPLFAANDVSLDVVVHDRQPTTLRVGEDDATVFLVDENTDIQILSSAHSDGIDVIANELEQTIQLDRLTQTSGMVHVDASGGDDSVILRGDRFTSLVGGDGYDRLVLELDVSTELIDFFAGRVSGFEEIVVANETETELAIDAQQLESFISDQGSLLIRTDADQKLTFVGDGTIEAPVMVGDEFAQVIRFGVASVQVVSQNPWQNALSNWDVNHSGEVTALDALLVINQIARVTDATLPRLSTIEQFSGSYFDVSGDGRISALDALRVINEVSRQRLGREGEAISDGILPSLYEADVNQERTSVVAADPAFAAPIRDSVAQKLVAHQLVALAPRDEAIRQLYVDDADEFDLDPDSERNISAGLATVVGVQALA